jgi:hypothetical protein
MTCSDWPLPAFRPRRSAYGIAEFRSRSGVRRINHALITEGLASEPHRNLFHLTYNFAPHSPQYWVLKITSYHDIKAHSLK